MSSTNLGSNKTHTLLSLECEKFSYKIVSCNVLMFPLLRCESNKCVKSIKYERNILWDNRTRYFSSNGEHSRSSSPWQCTTLLLNLFSSQYLYIVQTSETALLRSPMCERIDKKSQVLPLRNYDFQRHAHFTFVESSH